ncbi:translational GTPase TypA [Candidatus Saccharibacteria bacterium]|nr:translational GTPase TypA [Candidatus Saccharibacteria bacterium]
MQAQDPTKIRNVAIIAHVDHGKTTLVDGLLKQSNTFRDNQAEMNKELLMDSGDQEQERGITITAKITAVNHDGYRINIIDTPGHADFGGEVERTLNMADGCLLIVDAQEGPMPQTKFVLTKALALNLKPIVIINKIDKPGSRIAEVEDELADLFLELAVHEDQLHYPIYYAIGREGKAWKDNPTDSSVSADLSVIFNGIINDVPAPQVEADKPFQMMVTALSWDTFQGKYAVGRISRGTITPGTAVAVCKKDNSIVKARADKLYNHQGLAKIETNQAVAGDIISITGLGDVQIGETITDPNNPDALPVLEVEAPTLKIYLGPNTAPFKGREAEFSTSRQISDRLNKELETNIGLEVEQDGIGFLVAGRGELHLGVLIETMRREGFELSVGRPKVINRSIDGKLHEPIEHLFIDCDENFVGIVSEKLSKRKGRMINLVNHNTGRVRLEFSIPSRSLIGYRNEFLTDTRGTGIMNSYLQGYEEFRGEFPTRLTGSLVSDRQGDALSYALYNLEPRGILFVTPNEPVYEGMIVGEHNRDNDLDVNPCKGKKLTNMRASGKDDAIMLTPVTPMTLERAIDFIKDDELVEVTPLSIRLRKTILSSQKRHTMRGKQFSGKAEVV